VPCCLLELARAVEFKLRDPGTAPYPSVRVLGILRSFGHGVCCFSIVLLEFAVQMQVGVGEVFCLVEGFASSSCFRRRSSVDYGLLEVLHRNLASMKSETWEFVLHRRNGSFVAIALLGRMQSSTPCKWS